jgi:hypothetical protein
MTERIHPDASSRILATAQAIQKGVARCVEGGRLTEGLSNFASQASRWDAEANHREWESSKIPNSSEKIRAPNSIFRVDSWESEGAEEVGAGASRGWEEGSVRFLEISKHQTWLPNCVSDSSMKWTGRRFSRRQAF